MIHGAFTFAGNVPVAIDEKGRGSCTVPLTRCAVGNRIYTDLAVIEVTPNGFRLVELSPGIGFDFAQERTSAPLLRNPEPIAAG